MSLSEFLDTTPNTTINKEPGLMIIDFSQVVISSFCATFNVNEITSAEDVRKLTLNIIKNLTKKWKNKYPTVVIAVDSRNYWRRDIAPYYKGNRKEGREKSKIDFETIYKGMDLTLSGFEEAFPYIIMNILRCEADDVAGVLVKNFYNKYENIMLISSDSDWTQLQKYKNVKQWSSIQGGYVHPKHGGAAGTLMYKIIKGDKKDGIANILSLPDSVITKTRQKAISEAKLTKWIQKKTPEEFCDPNMLERFKHNKQLLDLFNIPEKYETAIMQAFLGKKDNSKSRSKIYSYLVKNRLMSLTKDIQDF